jgi:TM2 domain-containing membrane protein YozV
VKDPDTYAALNWLFLAGLHHFYLGRTGRGLVNLGVFAAGVAAIVFGAWVVGLVLILGVTAIELPALFRAERIVMDYNNRLTERLLREVTAQAGGRG